MKIWKPLVKFWYSKERDEYKYHTDFSLREGEEILVIIDGKVLIKEIVSKGEERKYHFEMAVETFKEENMSGKLSTNFWKKEFRCPCKKCRRKKVLVDDLLLFKLEMIRVELGNKPIIINSGNRCEEENKKVGGHPNSAHIPGPRGKAIDGRVKGKKPLEIGLAAEKVGGLRIGIGSTFCHLDVMPPNPSRFWVYVKGIPIYSAKIENKDLLKFYKIVMEGK